LKDDESECFSDEVDLEVARRLHSLHVSSLALYEVYFGFSDDQIRIGSPSVVSSCSEVPGSPTRFPSSDYRRKRNVLKPFRRGRKKKKMDQQSADWMEVADSFNGRSEMPEKGGNPLLKGHRYNPLTRGKQKLGTSSGKKKTARQEAKQGTSLSSPKSVVQSKVTQQSDQQVGKQSGINLSTGSGVSKQVAQPCEAPEDMEEESCDNFASSVPMVDCKSDSESDLSETADEQGREADDEESSFEAIFIPRSSSHWFEREPLLSSEDEGPDVFSTDAHLGSLLQGLQPIMSRESWKKFTSSLKDSQTMGNKRQSYKSLTGKRYLRRPQSRRPSQAKSVYLSPEEINQEIIRFVDTAQMDIFHLPLMSRKSCQVACDLAKLYGIRSSVVGESSMPVAAITLHRVPDTHMADQDMVREKIESVKQCSPPSLPLWEVCEGQEVGCSAPPIQEHNLGHKMLQNLGWVPGQGLGRNENGMVNPVHARMKRSKSGLGN
jgi:hypothetical protein